MSVVFNADGLQKYVKSNLGNNLIYLHSAWHILRSLDIPNDFKYYTQLKNYPKNIDDIKKKVKNIEKWIDEAIIHFKNAESNSTKEISTLSNILNTSINSFNTATSTLQNSVDMQVSSMSKEDITKYWNSHIENKTLRYKLFSNFFPYDYDEKDSIDSYIKSINEKASQLYNVPIEKVTDELRVKVVIYNEIKNKINAQLKEKSLLEKATDGLNSAGASFCNGVISFVKGIGEFGEAVLDTGAIVGTGIISLGTGVYDGITYLGATLNGNENDWESTTAKMWKGTMGFVAEKHVDNAFNKFYKDTSVGQWLDKNAYKPFKSNGMACKISSALGYISGVIILTIGTAGVGGAAVSSTSVTTTSATIAGTTSVGKYTADYWAEKRDSSWEGIERFYKNGEISKEQYDSYKMIRSLDDEQWKAIEIDFQNGNISKEEYEQIKQIKELPEDWTTLENGLKGLSYGTANGVWEGIQWYVGGKLAGKVFSKTSQFTNSAIRVGADTGFNALDTPFRTTVDSLASGKSWEQAWIEQGGWQSVLSNTGLGLVGSAGGEAIDVAKIKKGMNTLNNCNAFKNIDKSTANKVKMALMDDYVSGKVDITQTINSNTKNTQSIQKFSDFISTKNGDLFENLDNNMATKAIEKMACDYLNGKIKLSRSTMEKYLLKSTNIMTLDDAIKLTIQKKGEKPTAELIKKYKTEIRNGNYNIITKDQCARLFVDKYFKTKIRTIDDAIELTLKSSNSAKKVKIQEALANGDLSCITKDNGARTFVENAYKTKAKKYLAIQTNDKIFQNYGGFSYETNKYIINILNSIHDALDKAKVNGNTNFVDYLMKQNITQNTKKEISNYSKYNTWFRKLTIKEAQSTYAYTKGSGTIQKYLGTNKFVVNPFRPDLNTESKMIKTILGIDDSLNKGQILNKNQIFYRGDSYSNLKNWGFPDFKTLKAHEGKSFICNNYISTGVSYQGSFGGEVKWSIKCEAGNNYGAYVNEISEYFNESIEYEFLIKRGAKIKLNNVSLKNGTTYIDASIIGFSPKKLK